MNEFEFNIQLFSEIIRGTEGHDNISVSASEKVVYGYGGNDSIYNRNNDNVTIIGGDGADSIRSEGYYSNEGTNNISISSGAGNDLITLKGSNGVVNGDEDNDQISVYGGNNNFINGGSGNDKIGNSGENATIVGGLGNDSINSSGDYVYITGDDGADYLYNRGKDSSLIGNNGKDTIHARDNTNGLISGGAEDDSIKAEGNISNITIEGGAGNDTIHLEKYYSNDNVSAVINYSSGDGNDYIYGFNEDDTLQIAGARYSTTASGKNVIVNVGSGKITLDSAAGKSLNIVTIGGGTDTTPADTSGKYLANTTAQSVVTATNYADTILNIANNSTLNGDNGNDYIFNMGNNISIFGGAGNDTINATTGKVTINGGKGNDEVILYNGSALYQYATGDGNDTLSGFNSNDTLHVTSGSISKATVSGANVILTVGTGNITLLDAKNKTLKIKNGSGSVISTVIGGSSTTDTTPAETLPAGLSIKSSVLTASSSFTGNKIDLSDYQATKVNASALSKAVSIVGTSANNSLKGGKGADKIYGGAGNDTILGGASADSLFGETGNDLLKGEAGNDTLSGGSGNDTLTGGAGNDVFIFSAGKDVITDYTAGDKIKIESGTISKTTYSGTNVIFSIGSGSLTVKGGKGKKISIIDSIGKTTTKTYSQGVNARTLDLLDDNNFISNDTQLSDITEKKYSVTQIQPSNIENLAQDSSFLTFANKK